MNDKKVINILSGLTIALGAVLSTPILLGQASFTDSGYTQDFNGLPGNAGSSVRSFEFVNNSTLLGWYSTETVGRSSNGATSGPGRIYSWGETGSSDRALSLFSSAGYTNTPYLGLQLKNDTGSLVTSLTLTFDVEQWRRNENAVTWEFSYLVTSDPSASQLTGNDYTSLAIGNASSLTTGSPSALVGSDPANRQTVSVTITGISWQADEYLWLRWGSLQGAETAVGAIGIDNLSVTPIPESGAFALLLAIPLAVIVIRRRR